MAISRVDYGSRTLIDLTGDTVTAADLKSGVTAHGANGELITGSASLGIDTSTATATAADILEGKTAYVNGQLITGEMHDMTLNDGYYHIDNVYYWGWIAEGYHDGSEEVKIATNEVEKIIPENIKAGVTILGISGELTPLVWSTGENPNWNNFTYYRVEFPNTDNEFVATLVYDTEDTQYKFDEYAVTAGDWYAFDYPYGASPKISLFSPNSAQNEATQTNVMRIVPAGTMQFVFIAPSNGYVILCKGSSTSDTYCRKAIWD